MNIVINRKMIQDRCGTIAFKKGESFCNQNKVTFHYHCEDECEAKVSSSEDFMVTVKKEKDGKFTTTCTCPSIGSFQKECQHVAAVLLSLYKQQSSSQAEALLSIFVDQPRRSSAYQKHFENRAVLPVTFVCKVIKNKENHHLFGIDILIGQTKVPHIQTFLQDIMRGNSSEVSQNFTYDPRLHCFERQTYLVLEELLKVSSLIREDENLFIIPSSFWERIVALLLETSSVKLEYNGNAYDFVQKANEKLPLSFCLIEIKERKYHLQVTGLNQVTVMESYNCVLSQGFIYILSEVDCKRLANLQEMLVSSKTNSIPIAHDQLHFFMEKVMPGLQQIGHVQLLGSQFVKTPLVAKLYLDRVKDRLLAGLEFQYEHVVINPLEDNQTHRVLIRDTEKEAIILQLMKESEFTETDAGYYLQNEELEYHFLYHILPKLQKLLQVYATTAVRNRIFREKTQPQIRVKLKKERTNWLEFKFEMTGIADREIREVLQALEEKRKYYRLRNGSLLSLEDKEFREIEQFLRAVPVQKEDIESRFEVPLIEGMRLLSDAEQNDRFHLEQSFRQFLDGVQNPEQLDYEVPSHLLSILRPYQIQGFKWMKAMAHYRFGGILADDMGLGKTLQSIAFMSSELTNIRHQKQPALIVCPSSLTYNWLNEIKKFAPEFCAVIMDGTKEERLKKQLDIGDKDIIITSYQLLRNDLKWYEKQSFHTVFFDEAQAFKNPVTQTAKAAKKIQATNKFALTGTPVENSIEELWSIFHVVFPELFLGLKEYSKLSRQTISRRSRPFLLRRLKEDVVKELPEKVETLEMVELLPEQKKLYGAYLAKLREDTFKHLDKDTFRKNRIRILAGLTRLRQICCHPSLFVDGYKGKSAKFEQLLQIIEESQMAGRRVLIFSQFTSMLQLIGKELVNQGLSFFYLDGQTSVADRVNICDRFNGGERSLFLISLKAGGTGLNLTGADTVILYDLWWNPAVEEQAMDRAHRIGQKNVVQVIKLVTRGTIEEKMNELQEKKRHLIEEIIDPDEHISSTLTEEDIRELLMI